MESQKKNSDLDSSNSYKNIRKKLSNFVKCNYRKIFSITCGNVEAADYDDGNTASGDGCSDGCITEFCGGNIIYNNEVRVVT